MFLRNSCSDFAKEKIRCLRKYLKSCLRMKTMKDLLILVLTFANAINSEHFSSFKQLENLIDLNGHIVKALKQYISNEQNTIGNLDISPELFEMKSLKNKSKEQYAGNPINQFFIIKQLLEARKILERYPNIIQYSDIGDMNGRLPSQEDYAGVIEGIFRLQDTYNWEPRFFHQNTSEYKSEEPTADDYFEIGMYAFKIEDYYHALPWFLEAHAKLRNNSNVSLSTHTLLDYLSYTTYKQGNFGHARNLTIELLQIDPENTRFNENMKFFNETIEAIKNGTPLESWQMTKQSAFEAEHFILNQRADDDFYEKRKYEALCRGDLLENDANRLSKLMCRYRHNHKPYLLLNPVKEEEMFDSPRIVMYHDILNDREIEVLKRLAEPHLERALIHNPRTSALEPAQYRISKLCWLSESDHPVVKRVSKLIENLMNITTRSAEMLQIQNYGVGGHYEPHFDFSRVCTAFHKH
ncbi:hypothetical protein GJ496_011160 [Pomphorhynchus laevis]|nr:hypothetical protein GJ496_011160 [Pomphorhynchus laevis]